MSYFGIDNIINAGYVLSAETKGYLGNRKQVMGSRGFRGAFLPGRVPPASAHPGDRGVLSVFLSVCFCLFLSCNQRPAGEQCGPGTSNGGVPRACACVRESQTRISHQELNVRILSETFGGRGVNVRVSLQTGDSGRLFRTCLNQNFDR